MTAMVDSADGISYKHVYRIMLGDLQESSLAG